MSFFRPEGSILREISAEFLGTLLLTMCGNAVMATATLNNAAATGLIVGPLGWGLALMLAIFASGGNSGGHVNPAVSLGLASINKLPFWKLGHYFVAQYAGAFVGAIMVFILYMDGINAYDKGIKKVFPEEFATSQIFATYPLEHVSTFTAFFDQMLGTALLVMAICAITDERNTGTPACLKPPLIGLSLVGIALGFGTNCMGAFNPARDFSPRLFTLCAGWGTDVFSFRNFNWFWIPLIAPHFGGILGAWIYTIFIGIFQAENPEQEGNAVSPFLER